MGSNQTSQDSLQSDKVFHQAITLYIMSGGVGASGEQLARTVLAQFPDNQVQIELFPKVFHTHQVKEILHNAADRSAVVAHTFVNPKLRKVVHKTATKLGLKAIDLVGPLMETLSEHIRYKSNLAKMLPCSTRWLLTARAGFSYPLA